MEKQLTPTGKARFDVKIPKSQKQLFEYAASLGGFRTLTHFIINAVQEKPTLLFRNTIPFWHQKKTGKYFLTDNESCWPKSKIT